MINQGFNVSLPNEAIRQMYICTALVFSAVAI